MKATKILETEIHAAGVCSLPSRPTAPEAFGGGGYSSADLRAAFDRLPLLVIRRLNMMIDDVKDGSLSAEMPTGIRENHSLSDLFEDVISGNLAAYLSVGDRSLAAELGEIKARLAALERRG